VHAGCDNCYAEATAHRWGNRVWGNNAPRKIVKGVWVGLAKFQAAAAEQGTVKKVFVGSMMDIFEKPMPLIDSMGNEFFGTDTGGLRSLLFQYITRGDYPNLMFLLLTKRPSNIEKYIPESWKDNPPANVMYGTSISDQNTADDLIPKLLAVKGRHFLSIEPQLGPVDLLPWWPGDEGYEIDWVIQGGESGHKKRPFDLQWAYDLQEQCEYFEMPYFFKQIDKVQPIPADLMIREFPTFAAFNEPVK
jgi:protein gp37